MDILGMIKRGFSGPQIPDKLSEAFFRSDSKNVSCREIYFALLLFCYCDCDLMNGISSPSDVDLAGRHRYHLNHPNSRSFVPQKQD